MTYWTMAKDELFPEVTLCEEHALEATNIALRMMGDEPFETMTEAAVSLEASVAIFGQGKVSGFGFIEHEEGYCEECAFQAARFEAEEEPA